MESTEELRDALLALERENSRLQIESDRSRLLINAVERLLVHDASDPFASIFPALHKAFDFSDVVVLNERGNGDRLVCSVAEPPHLLDSEWQTGRFLERVLSGRVATMITNEQLQVWTDLPSSILSPRQPALYIPLKVDNSRSLMILFRKVGDTGFNRDHVQLASEFALLASLALAAKTHRQNKAERARLELLTERLRASEILLTRRANYDQLTGLPNREFAHDLLDRTIAGSKPQDRFALAFIDIDDFKRIKDTFGHGVGDQLLCGFAGRLSEAVRDIDVVSRISGDEFIIVLRDKDLSGALPIVEKLRKSLAETFLVDGTELWISATIGLAEFPKDGRSYAELHRAADIAMYHGKSEEKGSICLYDREMGDHASRTMEFEHALRNAIAERRFLCVFQPKVDINSSQIVGFEALARWRQRDGILRGPNQFIEQASALNLLDEITGLVFDDLLANIPSLDALFGSHLRYSLNISAKQIGRVGFVRSLIERQGSGGTSRRLMFEVTEDAFVDPKPFTHSILPLLSENGIGLSIDDFGTGYSSLSTLTNLPADELKVDRSFITKIHERPRNQSVLKAIESLAGTLGMTVVAEGVETMAEREYLRLHTTIGVAQGFLFAKPQTARELIEWRPDEPLHQNSLLVA